MIIISAVVYLLTIFWLSWTNSNMWISNTDFKILVWSLSDHCQRTWEYQYKNYSPKWNNLKSVLAKIKNKMLYLVIMVI